MGEIAEKLDSVIVRTMSPDGRLKAVLRNRSNIAIEFRQGSYRLFRERELEYQLSCVFSSLWTHWERKYLAVIAEHGVTVITAESAQDKATLRFLRERHDLVGSGFAVNGDVRAKTRGGNEWKFKLNDGVLGRLAEDELTAAVLRATAEATASRNAKLRELKRDCFDHPIAAATPLRT